MHKRAVSVHVCGSVQPANIHSSAACGENLLCNYRGEKMRETARDRDKIES